MEIFLSAVFGGAVVYIINLHIEKNRLKSMKKKISCLFSNELNYVLDLYNNTKELMPYEIETFKNKTDKLSWHQLKEATITYLSPEQINNLSMVFIEIDNMTKKATGIELGSRKSLVPLKEYICDALDSLN